MIFVTVGTDNSFDRMVKVVDEWAEKSGRKDIVAQIGVGGWRPKHVDWCEMLNPSEFMERIDEASVIIAHAGMGTILTALSRGKAILVMPKRASLGEHRNEHQMATSRHLVELGRINVAFDEEELREKLEVIDTLVPKELIEEFAAAELIDGLRGFIHGVPVGSEGCSR